MVLIIVGVLFALWLAALITGYLFGGLIHLLVVAAAVVLVIRMGRSPNPLRRG